MPRKGHIVKRDVLADPLYDNKVVTKLVNQVMLDGKKSSYYEVINSLSFPECNKALCDIMKQLNISAVMDLLDETPLISEVQRTFYKHILKARYDRILLSSYRLLTSKGQ